MKKIKVLIVTANPSGPPNLRVNQEFRDIQDSYRRSRLWHQFDLMHYPASRIIDLRRAILEQKPDFLHFGGHGLGGKLALEDRFGRGILIDPIPILKSLLDTTKCIFLNACSSAVSARLLSRTKNVQYAIGVDGKIPDDIALEFCIGFYDCIFAGIELEKAFACAKSSLPSGDFEPVLFRNERYDFPEQNFDLICIETDALDAKISIRKGITELEKAEILETLRRLLNISM